MKKIILFTFSVMLLSCGVSKPTPLINKKSLKGKWVLNNITYSKTGNYNITLFDDVSAECIEGSTWKFVSNNNKGTYIIVDENCKKGKRKFVFTVDQVDVDKNRYDLLIKPNNNPNNKGYRLKLEQPTDKHMQWQQTIDVDGTAFIMNINFTKID